MLTDFSSIIEKMQKLNVEIFDHFKKFEKEIHLLIINYLSNSRIVTYEKAQCIMKNKKLIHEIENLLKISKNKSKIQNVSFVEIFEKKLIV